MVPPFGIVPRWRLAMLGGLMMWAAQPPMDLWWLAWIAPLPWLLLIRQRSFIASESFPRRPYFALWLAGFLFWLGVLHWLRLPHWATSFGWVALFFLSGVLHSGVCRADARGSTPLRNFARRGSADRLDRVGIG